MSATGRRSARCRALSLELSRYLDGELAAARRRHVERHIDECACCKTMASRLKQTIAACRASKDRPLPRAVRARAAQRIRRLLARAGIRAS